MLHILVLLRALLADGVQTLSIDSILGTSVGDCFERISIGEKLTFNAIYRNVSELTSRECENLCKQDQQCQIYVYGVGAKGNASCELSNLNEREVKVNQMRHPDYDIYARRVQCEQSPPFPLQTSLNDPPLEPAHRPIFRPEIDEPKRPAPDFPDLRPFETKPEFYSSHKPNPSYDNHMLDRPDGCDDSKPFFDNPPSYGDHRPQDVPFRPNANPKPDSYHDVLQFQDQYGKPPSYPPYENSIYNFNSAGPNRPATYFPDEKPQNVYIQRPNKIPKPQEDTSYNKPVDNYDSAQIQGYGPIGPPPRPYKPSRPYEHPSRPFDYQGQYAGSYGSLHQDNYLDSYPHRPSRPINDRPTYNRPTYGYEGYQYGYGSSYGNNDNFYSQNHYESSYNPHTQESNITGLNTSHRPNDDSNNSYGVSSQSSQVFGQYGSQFDKPTQKPILDSNLGSYGTNQGYGSSQPSLTNNQNHYNNKPSSNDNLNQGSYSSNSDNTSPQYGHPSSSDSQSYGNNRPFNKPHPTYDDRPPKPSFNKPSYNRPSYSNDIQFSYHGYNPSYHYKPITDKPIDYDRPDPQYDPPPYGSQDSGSDDGGYRHSKKPVKPIQTNNYRPIDIKPVYEHEVDKPNNVPSFVLRPGGQVVTSKPVAVGDYGSSGREPGFAVSYRVNLRPDEGRGKPLDTVSARPDSAEFFGEAFVQQSVEVFRLICDEDDDEALGSNV